MVQETINAFNKRFPAIKVEMVRAPGGQLITRVKTEAAAGKLEADVIDHSDRGQMQEIDDLFQDYAPPNAADYIPDALVSPKLWPSATPGLVDRLEPRAGEEPAENLDGSVQAGIRRRQIGQVIGPSGGTTWTRIMFERQVLGEDYWAKQAATKPVLYPSGAPLSDAVVRGEVSIAPLLYNIVYPKKKDGAPIEIFFAPEGVPINPYGSGIPKTATHPNAARLLMNWYLSEEGQTFMIKDQGNLTSLKKRADLSGRLRPEDGQAVGARTSSSSRTLH